MAAVYKSIASSGADYTSLSAAEASIPNSSADDFTLEYIEAMSDNNACTVGIAGFTGTILITVAAPYRCNGAVYGSHAELNYTTDNTTTELSVTSVYNVTVQHLRIVRNTTAAAVALLFTTSDNVKVLNCVIVRRCGAAGGVPFYFNDCTNVVYAGNNLVITGFNLVGITLCAFYRAGATTSTKVYRNKFLHAAGAAKAIVACWGNAAVDAQQNVVIISAGTVANGGYDTDFGGAFHANSDSNVSSAAADCPGTNANNSETSADVFTDLTLNTENLFYPSRAKMQEQHAGNDLSATVGTVDNKGSSIGEWYPGSDYTLAAVAAVDSGRGLRLGMRLGL